MFKQKTNTFILREFLVKTLQQELNAFFIPDYKLFLVWVISNLGILLEHFKVMFDLPSNSEEI